MNLNIGAILSSALRFDKTKKSPASNLTIYVFNLVSEIVVLASG